MTTTSHSSLPTMKPGRSCRLLSAGLVLLGLAALDRPAAAACTWTYNGPGGTAVATSPTILIPPNINFGSLGTIPADTPAGTALSPTMTFTLSASGCPAGQYFNLKAAATPAVSPTTVWQVSGTPGVGVEVKLNGTTLSSLSNGTIQNLAGPGTAYASATYSVRLVKTSTQLINNNGDTSIGTGYQSFTTASGSLFIIGAAATASTSPPTNFRSPGIQATFPVSTCVTQGGSNYNVGVTLPAVKTSVLASVGSTAGDTGFNFTLSCTAGSTAYVTLTDNQLTTNTGNLLTLAPQSTASGVALQILYNGSAVNFGPASSLPGNIGQFSTNTATPSGTLNIPFTVRYIRTGALVPGTVKAVATVTMSYQ